MQTLEFETPELNEGGEVVARTRRLRRLPEDAPTYVITEEILRSLLS